jgi:hypothetical protein
MICELVLAASAREITAAQAARVFGPSRDVDGAVGRARYELAVEFLEDLRGIDAQMRDTKKRLVRAGGGDTHDDHGDLRVGPVRGPPP